MNIHINCILMQLQKRLRQKLQHIRNQQCDSENEQTPEIQMGNKSEPTSFTAVQKMSLCDPLLQQGMGNAAVGSESTSQNIAPNVN